MLRKKLPVVALAAAIAAFIFAFIRYKSGNMADGYAEAKS